MNSPRERIEHIDEMLGHLEADLDARSEEFGERVRGKELSIRILVVTVVCAAQMDQISGHVETIRKDFDRIEKVTRAVDTRVQALDRDTRDMADRFRRVNHAIGGMDLDVEQMSRPVP